DVSQGPVSAARRLDFLPSSDNHCRFLLVPFWPWLLQSEGMPELVRRDELCFRGNIYDAKCRQATLCHTWKCDIETANSFEFSQIELFELPQQVPPDSLASMTVSVVNLPHHLPVAFPFASQANKAHDCAKILWRTGSYTSGREVV